MLNSDSSGAPSASFFQRARAFLVVHPTWSTFLLMAPIMVIILLVSIQSVPLEPTQRLAMALATVALAGACAWIISIED